MKKQIKTTLPPKTYSTPSVVLGNNDDVSLSKYIAEIQQFPILTAEQEYEYATRWTKEHDNIAAEKLVGSHLRLVVSVAYDFKNYGLPISDLIASGNMGLMQALQKFDPERGFRFSTYAMFWIKAEIYETILNNWSIVKLGSSANQKRVFFNLTRAKRALGIMDNTLSADQTKQIAEYLSVPESDVEHVATRMSARDMSLNAPLNTDSDAKDILSNMADSKTGIEESVEQLEFKRRGYELLRKHLENLPERDREILRARRLSDPAATLETLSQKYGISRERVRQIEERAYNKLREAILADAENKPKMISGTKYEK
ncbi:MAG: RNA polymerase factor sigma-32 [Alphaproteobacteria bacterium]|nr:RNA polymerase factor sigma-32 [Alphaproteobacteria bacterium]